MRLTLITLALIAVTLTACGSDPLGLVAREQVRTQGAIEIAQIDAATTRATAAARIGGAVALAGIASMTIIALGLIASATHIVAQGQRLSMDDWRNHLPAAPTAAALPAGQARTPAGHWIVARRATAASANAIPEPHILALPAHSASGRDIVVIDG